MKVMQPLRLALTTGLLVMLAASSQAANIKLTYQNNLSLEGAPTGSISGVDSNVAAGEFDFSTSDNTTGIGDWDESLSAFCVEIDTYLNKTETQYEVSTGLGDFEGTQAGVTIDRLFSSYYETSQETTQASAAMQLALWEITNEGASDLDMNDGTFRSSWFSGAKALANNWLSSLDESSASGKFVFHSLASDDSQDLLTVTKASVPEPGTLFLLATGLLALIRARGKISA